MGWQGRARFRKRPARQTLRVCCADRGHGARGAGTGGSTSNWKGPDRVLGFSLGTAHVGRMVSTRRACVAVVPQEGTGVACDLWQLLWDAARLARSRSFSARCILLCFARMRRLLAKASLAGGWAAAPGPYRTLTLSSVRFVASAANLPHQTPPKASLGKRLQIVAPRRAPGDV